MRRARNISWRYRVGWLLLPIGVIVYLENQPDDDRVQRVCRRALVGSLVADLNRYAAEVGLGDRIVPTGITSLVAGKTYGRHRCEIEAVDGVVRDVKFGGKPG